MFVGKMAKKHLRNPEVTLHVYWDVEALSGMNEKCDSEMSLQVLQNLEVIQSL